MERSFKSSFGFSTRMYVFAAMLACAFFIWRGALGSQTRSSDLYIIYGGVCAFADDANPYVSSEALKSIERRNTVDQLPVREIISLYPPSTYLLMRPLAAFDWETVRALWLIVQLASVIILIVGLFIWSNVLRDFNLGWILIIGILLFAPVHTGLRLGQLALPVCALSIAGLLLTCYGRPVLATICLSIACALKPQLGVGLACVPLLMGRGYVTLFSGMLCLGILGQSMFMLSSIGFGLESPQGWLISLQENIQLFASSGDGSVGTLNLKRHELLNAAYPISLLTGGTNLDAWFGLIAALLVVLFVFSFKWKGWFSDNCFTTAMITPFLRKATALLAIATLMSTYHRSYDAVLLLFALAWLLSEKVTSRSRLTACICLIVFLVPTPALLYTLNLQGVIDLSLLPLWIKNGILMSHQAWAVVILGIAVMVSERPKGLE